MQHYRNGVKLVSLTDWIEVCLSLELDEVMESLVHPGTEIKGIVETGKTIGSKQCGTLEFGGFSVFFVFLSFSKPLILLIIKKHGREHSFLCPGKAISITIQKMMVIN
ncbi:hypothetical protein S83_007569 [Arachis hypogaea]|nr:uncharacterized protein DS421_3g73670 [Arachis hypogaea]